MLLLKRANFGRREMNRRQIFNRLSAFLLGVVAMPKLGWANVTGSSHGSVEKSAIKNEDSFTTVREFESLIHPNKTYPDIKAFWLDHPDQVSDVLKKEYINKNLLVSKSILLEDGKTVRQTKTYKTERHFRQYQKSIKSYYSKSGKTFIESLKRIS